MSTQTGNSNVSADFLRVLLALKSNVMRNLSSSEIAIVKKISNDDYTCATINNSKEILQCTKLFDLDIKVNDVVLITFTKSDFRQNLRRIKQNLQLIDYETETLHSLNYGVITGLIYRKEND